ncbi:AsmA family protein [Agarivorans aestuarii]|uniref:AsmA family protein n=1 Tax=Agarivorans aestuarii TaxID=1563703 RepID=UPI001C807931|nr:AsmA family protein [Agarivorans aestuarii]
MLVAILLLPLVILLVGLKVEIGDSRQLVTKILSEQLQRDVRIEGNIQLELSFRPAITVENIHIANPRSFGEQSFAQVRKASAQVQVLPLLRQHLEIEQILLDGFYLDLIRNVAGENNWQFASGAPEQSTAAAAAESSEQETSNDFTWQGTNYSFEIEDQILISDARISYADQAAEAVLSWQLEELKLTSLDSETLAMTAKGSMLDERYSLDSTWQLEPLLQGRAGDVQLNMQVADASFGLSGQLAPQKEINSYLELKLDWQNADSIARLLGENLSHIAPIKLATRFDGKPGSYSLSPISATLGSSQLSGELALTGHQPVAINGNLEINQIDLGVWLPSVETNQSSEEPLVDTPTQPKPNKPAAAQVQEAEALPLLQIVRYWLNQADADLSLSIGKILGLPLEVSSVSLGLKVEGEQLKAPLRAVVDEIRFRGNLKASVEDDSLNTSMRLVAQKSPLDKLASRIPLLAGSTGSIGRSVLRISATGSDVTQLLASSQFNYKIEDSRMSLPAGTKFDIKSANLHASLDSELELNLDGVLLDIPVNALIHTSPLRAMLNQQAWQVRMQLDSPAIELNLNGELPSGVWQQGASLQLNANSPRIGLLAPWLGVDSKAQGPLKLELAMQAQQGKSSLKVGQLQIADSKGTIQASWDKSKTEQGLVSLESAWQGIHLAQLMDLMPSEPNKPKSEDKTAAKPLSEKATIDIRVPILPQGFAIHDADLAISIEELLLGEHQFENLELQASARDGWLQQAPFSGEFAQSKIAGNATLDLRSSPLKLDFSIASEQPNIAQLLKQLNIAEQANLALDRAELDLSLQGDDVAQLLASTTLSAKLIGGYWDLVDPNTQASARIELDEGSLSASPKKPLVLALKGELKQLPLNVQLSTLSLAEFTQKPSELPLKLSLDVNQVNLQAKATLPRPVSLNNLSLAMQLTSPSLSQLDSLHGVQLPPFGPIKLAGELQINEQGYAINNMLLAVANSELTGLANLSTVNVKPQLDIAISANNIQLDDFKTGDWQGLEQRAALPAEQTQSNAEEQNQVGSNDVAQPLLSQAVFQRLNANFSLDVERVKSGKDWLGEGKLHWQLHDGSLRLAPLWLALPGGEIDINGELSATGSGFYSQLKAEIENFDYGLLARRIKPDTEMRGSFSLHLDVNSEFEQLEQWLESANGKVGFAVWPKEFEAGIMDLWAVSLASAVVPELDDSDKSVLNCVVAAFDSDNGKLVQNVLLADTSRIRVLGETEVDFKQQQVKMVLRPKAKRAQIFGLSTPVQVTGSFEDFKIGIVSGGLIGTTIRFVTSPVVSPLRWIVEAPLDADGSELCRQAWQQAKQVDIAN